MAATIRLMRFGKRKNPHYRIIVLDKRKKRDGAYIEKIGLYRPFDKEKNITIEKKRFDNWIEKGAQLSEGMQRLLKNKKQVYFT
ncbi:30S ribosomal protein S16 [Candidatus Roizmanbacteria bacterium RIFCSPLOWO2_01_FULL_38_12]|uniref:Small ribosomal subunit protein bS16 n=1 Tax=Candidatus Roizmanbacteria bacterium RIFCSPLOWO2_01_FULL_38_12 TaxID=1802061 RepID=A0A1F7IUZ5_9BACT|nr:MAG: 30S ribosomal protein S16 [Candidatus Roizmanbacteria bacterium RIFCSPHIGHO2_01_FULL_38_15]OGK35034.1 MAG: 30S ribosomal protein S16 [Candidatus Roizmanbacteria bacterium RIFCSPHIGHO2_12_FULL_38_13]OGK47189.1 MAG: 30S ribosomal protein S16 [Candidatus Roizmanbacteria bacterium RIFCSPLOWO2_01_FULL_38_12]